MGFPLEYQPAKTRGPKSERYRSGHNGADSKSDGRVKQQGCAPFVELTGFQGSEGVRHLGDERFREAQEPSALGRGLAPGEGDLRSDAGAELVRRYAGVGLFAALGHVEGDGVPGLPGGQG